MTEKVLLRVTAKVCGIVRGHGKKRGVFWGHGKSRRPRHLTSITSFSVTCIEIPKKTPEKNL